MSNPVEERVYAGLLFQVYGGLLTDRQQSLVRAYYYEDLSLGEVASNFKISRQAVSDQVGRAIDRMKEMEGELKILDRQKILRDQVKEVLDLLDDPDLDGIQKAKKKLKDLVKELTLLT